MAVLKLIWLVFLPKRMAGAFRRMAKKLNHSSPLRAPDGVAFPLPSRPCFPILRHVTITSEHLGLSADMSEFSDSYHIRTDDPAKVKQLLRQARLAGIIFGPSGGWLTFIPYEELTAYRRSMVGDAFTVQLSRVLSATVLHYNFSEDHGWSFAVARPGEKLNRFACWWDPEPTIEREQLDLGQLASIANLEALAPLLQGFDATTAHSRRPAYRFAEQLRLPTYKWLSPNLAQHHTDDLIAQGGSKLGTKPPSAAERLQLPPARKIELPRPDLSAREALELITPFVCSFGTAWRVAGLFGGGRLKQDGRLEPGVGVWQFTYMNPEDRSGDAVGVWLFFNGNLSFHGQSATGQVPSGRRGIEPLEGNWLDSSEIAEIVDGEPRPDGIKEDYSLSMSLRPIDGAPLMWEVTRLSVGHPHASGMVRHVLVVDAATGEVVFETLERREHGKAIHARQRRRWEGTEWENIPANGDPAPDSETLH